MIGTPWPGNAEYRAAPFYSSGTNSPEGLTPQASNSRAARAERCSMPPGQSVTASRCCQQTGIPQTVASASREQCRPRGSRGSNVV